MITDMPEFPTVDMLRVFVDGNRWPEDWERGKEMQNRPGTEIPFKTEWELAAGQYKRLRAIVMGHPIKDADPKYED